MPNPQPKRQQSKRKPSSQTPLIAPSPNIVKLRTLLRVASVACGIQFGWALQLSLLTPYVQELGIPHAWSSIIWLCGPLSGFLVQPLVGHFSDHSTSRFGRRRPFILAGGLTIIIAVLIIGFSADIGWFLGDRGTGKKMRAVVVFVIGFWLLDVANNMTQGPCRALLADLSGKDHRRTRVANAYFSLFMAVGNVLGYATGSFSSWFKILPFTLTSACNVTCANLKAAFLIDILFVIVCTYISLSATNEQPPASSSPHHGGETSEAEHEAFLWEIFGIFKFLPNTVWVILLVTSLNWIGWFPFLLYDTDWMGREIYGGKPNEGENYNMGVRMGALGLMLNSVVLGISSVFMEKLCRKWGAGCTWGISSVFMALCFVAMVIITMVNSNLYIEGHLPPNGVVVASLVVFALLGIPLAITYSVPYALVSTRIESLGLGQGLSLGVLNVAIVFPQVIVSLGSGPWDELFGGGNSPAFVIAAISALFSGLIAILAIPRTRIEKPRTIPH